MSSALYRTFARRTATASRQFNRYPLNTRFASNSSSSSTHEKPKKRSLGRTLFLTAVVTPALIFVASIPLAYYSPEFREFVTESLPGGGMIDDLLYDYELRKIDKLAGGNSQIGATANALQHAASNLSKALIEDKNQPRSIKGADDYTLMKHKNLESVPINPKELEELKAKAAKKNSGPPEKPAAGPPLAHVKPSITTSENNPEAEKAKTPIFAQKPRDVVAEPVQKPKPKLQVYEGELPVGYEPPPGYIAKKNTPNPDIPAQATNPTLDLPKITVDLDSLSSKDARALGEEWVSAINKVSQLLEAERAAMLEPSVRPGAQVPGEYGQQIHKATSDAQVAIKTLLKHIEKEKDSKEKIMKKELSAQKKSYEKEVKESNDAHAKEVARIRSEASKVLDTTKKDLEAKGERVKKAELEAQESLINARLKAATLELSTADRKKMLREARDLVDEVRSGRYANLQELAEQTKTLESIAVQNQKEFSNIVDTRRLETAVHALQSHAAAGKPVIADLIRIVHMRDDPLILATLGSISDEIAYRGTTPFADLSTRFSQSVTPHIRNAVILPDQATPLSYLFSSTVALFTFQRSGWATGNDVDSIISRAQYFLDRHDLDNATRQVNSLTGWPKQLASDWLHEARKTLELQQAIDILKADVTARATQCL